MRWLEWLQNWFKIQVSTESEQAIHHLGGVPAPAVNAALLKIAENTSDTAPVRATGGACRRRIHRQL